MVRWRPVDCVTHAPLPASPGYIDRSAVYSGGPQPGWSWQPYSTSNSTLITASAPTPSGKASTCLTISPGGGLAFKCRDCYKPGYRPFEGVTAIRFVIRSNTPDLDPYESDTPRGQLPNLRLILRKAEAGQYCKAEPTTLQFAPGGGNGTALDAAGWFRVSVPTGAFDCPGGGISLGDATQLDVQNADNVRNAIVCVGDVELVR